MKKFLLTNGKFCFIMLFVVSKKLLRDAEVAELADAHGSGPCGSNTVRVQVSSSARRRPFHYRIR